MKIKTWIIKYLLVIFMLLAYSNVAFAIDPPIIAKPEDVTWEIYTDLSRIRCMAFSDEGNTLWVGTLGGLEERNLTTGQLIKLYTNLDGLPENDIQSLASDNSGGVWIGTYDDGGLAHLSSNGIWTVYNTDNSSLPNDSVKCITSDIYGGLWIGTFRGLAHISVGNKSEAEGGETCTSSDLDTDDEDVGTEVFASQAVYHWGDTIEVLVKNSGSGFYDQYTAWVYPDGTLQFITEENGFVSDLLSWASTPQMDSIPETIIKLPYMFELPHGTYWVYNLLVPAGTTDIFQNIENWTLNYNSFVVK